MSLINEQQRDKAQQEQPVIKPVQVNDDGTQQVVEFAAPGVQPLTTQQQTSVNQFPDATPEKAANPKDLLVPLPPPVSPSTPTLTPVPSLFRDVREQQISPYAPEVVNTSLPSLYTTTPDTNSSIQAAQALVNSATTRYQEQSQREQQQTSASDWAKRVLEDKSLFPNVPNIDRPWYISGLQAVGGFLGETLFGNEEENKLAEQGVFRPLAGTLFDRRTNADGSVSSAIYGRSGVGVGGFFKYLFDTGGSLFVGAASELNKLTSGVLQGVGVPKQTSENFARDGVLGLLPENVKKSIPFLPSNVLGFDFEQARKNNQLLQAIAGDPIRDINEPKESTQYGRVYYSPRRKVGQAWYEDPVGAIGQIALEFTNPGDAAVEYLLSPAWRTVFRRGTQPTEQVTREITGLLPAGKPKPPDGTLGLDLTNLTEQQLRQQRVGTPKLTGTSEPNIPRLPGQIEVVDAEFVDLPPAAKPSNVPRVYIGETSVTQKLLPPAVDPGLAPPTTLEQILPTSNPASTVLKIGIGTPNTQPITDVGELALRPYSQVIQQIELTNPKLLEGYKGVTWEELKQHLSRNPKLDLSQFNVVGQELTPEIKTPALPPVSVVNNSKPVVKTYEDALKRLNASYEQPTDLEEIAAIVQELATERGLSQREINLSELLPVAIDKFNKGKRINLNETLITKEYRLSEADVLNRQALVNRLTERGIKLTGQEDTRVLDVALAELQKSDSTVERVQKLIDNKRILLFDNVEDIPKVTGKHIIEYLNKENLSVVSPATPKITTDDLATAAEELAAHKQAIQTPLTQLRQLSDDIVDFGRRPLENLEPRTTTVDEVLDIFENGGKPNILRQAYDSVPDFLRRPLQSGDFDNFIREATRAGEDPLLIIRQLVDDNNTRVSISPISNPNVTPTKALTSLPPDIYHGTAFKGWTPDYNIGLGGSRGELGSGFYLTRDVNVATDYARARVSDNVSPSTLDLDIEPAVYSLQSQLKYTLDANAKLPSNDQFFSELTNGLPQELVRNLKKAVQKTKTQTYSGFLTKLESNLLKSGLEPTEDVLQQVQRTVSDNLRRIGYDSVYDGKSGFALVLDNSKISTRAKTLVEPTDETTAALARYNADAYAAKSYPNRLTTDANLRDSAAKLLNQMSDNVDQKLLEVQEQLKSRTADTIDSVLPKLEEPATTKPKSVAELMDEISQLTDDICG